MIRSGKMAKCWDFSDILMKIRIHDYESMSLRVHEDGKMGKFWDYSDGIIKGWMQYLLEK
jgi:hypothetical protein